MKTAQKMYARIAKKRDERGVASILSVIFFIILMSVLTVSFMRMVTDEQNQVLNDDLGKGALAAAQSGVEDAKRALIYCRKDPSHAGCSQLYNTTCPGMVNDDLANALGLAVNAADRTVQVGNPVNNQRYTCVVINPETSDYEATMKEESVELIPLRGVSSFNAIRFSWRGVNENPASPTPLPNAARLQAINGSPAPDQMPRKPEWHTAASPLTPARDYLAVARLQLLDFDHTATLDAQRDNSSGMFLVPSSGGTGGTPNNIGLSGITPTALGNKRQTVSCGAGAQAGYRCTATVSFPAMTVPSNHEYFLAVKSYYASAEFKLELLSGSLSSPTVVPLDDVQPEVDSTGVAGNAYKRVISRVAYAVNGFSTTNVIESGGGICKDFFVTKTDYNSVCDPGGSPSGLGDATIGGWCDFHLCSVSTPVTGPDNVSWGQGVVNMSANDPKDVDHCLWTFGDGTTSTSACNWGDSFTHMYPDDPAYKVDNTLTRKRYTVTLTVWLKDGTSKTDSKVYWLPYNYPW